MRAMGCFSLRVVSASTVALAALAILSQPALAGAPAGASARCGDGTYSFSQHHSGTCSRHGGVAAWLDGSRTVGPASAVSPAPAAAAAVDVGRTLLLARRTRTDGCRLGANPDRRCSPGALSSGLTTAVICSSGFHTSSVRRVPESVKFAVERAYGLRPGHYGRSLEIDHIVALELGGSNDIANLYPEQAGARP